MKNTFLIFLILLISSCNNSNSEKEKINKALKEGKEIIYKSDGSVEIKNPNSSEYNRIEKSIEKSNNESYLSEDEITIINSLNIDLNLCSDLKKITREKFKKIEVENQSGKNINPDLLPKLVENKNISDSTKKDISDYLKKKGFKQTIKDNWSNGKNNVYFIKDGEKFTLIISSK